MKIEELFQQCLDLSPEQKVTLARSSSQKILTYLSNKLDAKTTGITALMLIATCVGIDGTIDVAEHAFCKAVFGFEYDFDEFASMVKAFMSNAETVEMIDKLIDYSPQEIKAEFVSFALLLCSCNGILTDAEQRLIIKYIQ